MFVHAGFRPLWPVIAFAPWFLLGIAYLIESWRKRPIPVVHRRHRLRQRWES
jgi:hypothetical protein